MWDDLTKIGTTVVGEWASVGDFNNTLYTRESAEGASKGGHRDMEVFLDFVHECSLIDIGF